MGRFFVLQILCLSFGLALALSLPAERQTPPLCNSNTDCYPLDAGGSIPTTFVSCFEGACQCSSCFMQNTTSGRCETMPNCTVFDYGTISCIDNRQNQLTAFLLAFFLTWVGAANFYIGQLGLAIPQLIIGVFLFFMSCASRIHRSVTKDSEEKSCLLISCCCALFLLVLSLIEFAWWLADVIIFGINDRLDGNGCPLNPNL